MANVSTTIKRLSVDFLEATTEVYVYMDSTEPDNPFWGNGCKHKSYPATRSLLEILPDMENYLNWHNVCPTCHKDKNKDQAAGFCGDVYHVDPASDMLSMFNENVAPPDNGNTN